MNESDAVEDIAASLIREYLSRKGLKNTLRTMDDESPRGYNSISNRQLLMKQLHLEQLMKKNKSQARPYRTMVEVMSKNFLDGPLETRSNSMSPENIKQVSKWEESDRRVRRVPSSDNFNSDKSTSSSSMRGGSSQSDSWKSNLSTRISANHSDDLVIDDNVESETLLGEGKAALIDRLPVKQTNGSLSASQTRPRSSGRARGLGMAGPISSNIDESRRKFHKPRAYSAASNFPDWRNDLLDNNSSLCSTTTDITTNSSASITSSANSRKSSITEPSEEFISNQNTDSYMSDLNLAKSKRKQLEDLLNADPEKAKSGHHIKKRHSEKKGLGEVTPSEVQAPRYNVGLSSMSLQTAELKNTRNGILRRSSQTSINSGTTKVGDLEIGDCDDLDAELADLDIAPKVQSRPVSKVWKGFPIDLQTAVNLKMLIFGSSTMSFNDEWKYQSFTFSDLPKLMYGIVQKKGGACGVLAAVQAVLLQEMLFNQNKPISNKWNEPSREERSRCLARGISRILWRAGEERNSVVTLEGRNSHFDGGSRFKEDGLTEKLTLYNFTQLEKLEEFMKENIRQFELDGHSAVVLTLYSAILSRGIDRITNDMDEPTGKLMGAHGYCTQDMVNLLLTGRAVSNVFNDIMELDSGGVGKPMILRGLSGRNNIGLLSLFEHYQSCQVGTYFKTPRYPIWVVCSESHFSVLFSLRKDLVNDWKAERRFDLFYYDGLGKQEEQIKLTIDTTSRHFQAPSDDDLVPPLEHCIRTKWSDAEIDWNGTEPIL